MYNVIKVNLNHNNNSNNQESISYLLVDKSNVPITSACKFLKHISLSHLSSSTVRNYAYNLKIYFEYLDQVNINYLDASPNLVIKFASYLSNTQMKSSKSIKSFINIISKFYEFLNFLHMNDTYFYNTNDTKDITLHISSNNPVEDYELINLPNKSITNFIAISDSKNIIKYIDLNMADYKHREKGKKILTYSDMNKLYSFVSNKRDAILIKSLYETGAKGNEILNLSTDDIVTLSPNKYGIKLHSKENHLSKRVIPISNELARLIFDYIDNTLTSIIRENNLIFIHLKGSKVGRPLSYSYISSLLKHLKIESNINISLNTLRYSAIINMFSTFKDASTIEIAYLAGLRSHVSVYNYLNNIPCNCDYSKYISNKLSSKNID